MNLNGVWVLPGGFEDTLSDRGTARLTGFCHVLLYQREASFDLALERRETPGSVFLLYIKYMTADPDRQQDKGEPERNRNLTGVVGNDTAH